VTQVPAVLKATSQLPGGEATATVQLVGVAQIECFHDGYAVDHAIPKSLLVPGADVVVDIPDLYHPGDGQVVSVAHVSAGADHGSAKEQFGSLAIETDGSGNGSAAIAFPNIFSSFTGAPDVTLTAETAQLASGSLSTAAVTAAGLTVNVSGATPNSAVSAAWDAQGT